MKNAHRAEYLRRIHSAQDYIERHLDEALPLEDVAKVACFSPFHFHRLYSAITGESLYQFILRLRLERAASHLASNPNQSITEIALGCGFSSSATFARAFRAEYGLSASSYRNQKANPDANNRKDWVALRKDGKAGAQAAWDDVPVDPFTPSTRTPLMTVTATRVTVEDLDAFTVAYVRHVGPYAGDSALFGRLFGRLAAWAGPRGLLGPNTKSLCIYHDNPEVTAPEKLRTSCCISVPPGTRVDGEVGLLEIPKGAYAQARFEVSSSEFGAAWDWFLGTWLPESGYQPADGLCYERCLNNPSQHPEGKHLVDLVEPVRPL